MCRSGSCRKRCLRSLSRISITGRLRRSTMRFSPAGRIRPKTTASGANLAYQWAKHCTAKYGLAEAKSWYWEVWNEPNIGYWQGTPEEYYKLYDYAVDGVRRALPTARVGGAEIAGGGGRQFAAPLSGTLRSRDKLRDGKDRLPAGLCFVSCQRVAGLCRRPCANGAVASVQRH